MSFHEIRFPTHIALNSSGGPERRTEIVTLGSGYEERNSRWLSSRRRYNAGYGAKELSDLYDVIEFFEERRGRLYGFRWKDPLDYNSSFPHEAVQNDDQLLATGDGTTANFQLIKHYGSAFSPWIREIKKPVEGTVLVSVDGRAQIEGEEYTLDLIGGQIRFQDGHIPAVGLAVHAGFEFDVPVRFDSDQLEINLSHFKAGRIPNIPIVEVLI